LRDRVHHFIPLPREIPVFLVGLTTKHPQDLSVGSFGIPPGCLLQRTDSVFLLGARHPKISQRLQPKQPFLKVFSNRLRKMAARVSIRELLQLFL
jgi:hypothetical protein